MLVTATAPHANAARRVTAGRRVACRPVARRVIAAIASATAAVLIGSVAVPTSAAAAGTFVSATNGARAAAGLAPLTVSSDLTAAATRQANAMAQSSTLYHTPNLASVICCWQSVGENVGMGPSIAAIHAAFMASPAHRANILNHAYTQIGVGYAVDGHGSLWVSEIFRRPSGAAPAAAPKVVVHAPVAKAPATKPAVVAARPAPAPAKITTATPTPAAVATDQVSRDYVRVPVEVAQRSLAQLSMPDAVSGTNPVSRLLDFAAKAASQN